MINWDKSAAEYDMSVDELQAYFEKYPNSTREVYRICDGGCVTGDRWISHRWYSDLCQNCSKKICVGENSSNWKGGKISLICDYCGKKIERFPSDIRGLTFCKKECHNKWMEKNTKGENNPLYGICGKDNPRYGTKNTEYTLNLMSESAKKRKYDSKICIICGKYFIPNNNVQVYCKKCDRFRPHLTPIHACIQLNQRFPGSEGHHIMSSVVIFLPKNLHQGNYHNLKTGQGMVEINILAFNFLLGAQWYQPGSTPGMHIPVMDLNKRR